MPTIELPEPVADGPAPATGSFTARWASHRLFPYERRMGLLEAERLGMRVVEVEDELHVLAGDAERLVERATYLTSVASPDGRSCETRQAAVERVHRASRGLGSGRQATRYGLHGLHEYKGKFNPQIVRAVCNTVDPDAEVLIDPFCGSGTSLLEGLRLGLDVVGIDRSPMARFLASTKIAATVHEDPGELAADVRRLGARTTEALGIGQEREARPRLDGLLSDAAVEYLESWFTPPAFGAMSQGLALLLPKRGTLPAQLALAALSSIVRSVSLQVPEDLRIRRRPADYVAPPLDEAFATAIARVEQGLREVETWPRPEGVSVACLGSAEQLAAYDAVPAAGRRLIVTSPPYATALPYIDTDRISMVALSLTEPRDLAARERELIGSREWNRAQEREWDARRTANEDRLPAQVVDLLTRISDLNATGGAGFRRRAVPSLLYRYFARMRAAMGAWTGVLRPGECAALVVGRNRTTAGGVAIDIATPELLGEVAAAEGFEVLDLMPLETWPRYGLHAVNGVAGEDLLVLRRGG